MMLSIINLLMIFINAQQESLESIMCFSSKLRVCLIKLSIYSLAYGWINLVVKVLDVRL